MLIHSPIFSGSIIQDKNNAYANLSGSFTGSITGSFKGEIDVQQATFNTLIINNRLVISGSLSITGSQTLTGPLYVSGATQITGGLDVHAGNVSVDGVNILDTALAYSIALG
jgi:hypothetical protein